MANLELIDLRKSYDKLEVIHGINLQVTDGEFCVLVGPSGCGKSTLLRMIAGLEAISEGSIIIDGKKVNNISAANRGLAMVFQSYALYPHMSVRQNLAFGLENLKMKKNEIEERIQQAAKLLRMEEYLKRRPGQLSGGQRQRVAIGRAIVREPSIYLFDEPLSNLDAELRVATRVELKALHERLGNTMIYVTHDQTEAMSMADKIVLMNEGEIVQQGSPKNLFKNPEQIFTAKFIGNPPMNLIEAESDGKSNFIIHDENKITLITDEDQRKIIGLRPEDIRISETGIKCKVNYLDYHGADAIITTILGNQNINIKIDSKKIDQLSDEIFIEWEIEDLKIFDYESGKKAAGM